MNFPDSPAIGATFSSSIYNWVWNGKGWEVLNRNGTYMVQFLNSITLTSITTVSAEAVSIDLT